MPMHTRKMMFEVLMIVPSFIDSLTDCHIHITQATAVRAYSIIRERSFIGSSPDLFKRLDYSRICGLRGKRKMPPCVLQRGARYNSGSSRCSPWRHSSGIVIQLLSHGFAGSVSAAGLGVRLVHGFGGLAGLHALDGELPGRRFGLAGQHPGGLTGGADGHVFVGGRTGHVHAED